MGAVVFTTVTLGEAWDTLEPAVKSELTRWLERYDPASCEYERGWRMVQENTALSPATGRVVAVGVQDVAQDKGVVYTELPVPDTDSVPTNWQARSGDEATMLAWFWRGIARYQVVVSFAGHSFGLPFIAHRAMRHEITPRRALFGARRLREQHPPYHVDLQDELSFYGAWRKRLSLPLWCHTYGIDISYATLRADIPQLQEWHATANTDAITQHVVAKLQATTALYHRWCAHLAPTEWSVGGQVH